MVSASPPAPLLQVLRWQSRTQVFRERLDGLELAMVRIPAGSFVMGSPPKEPERRDNEGPQHRVELGEFLMGQTPITQAQWRVVAGWSPPAGKRWDRDLEPEPSFFQPRANPKARNLGDGRFSLFMREANSDERPVDNVSWLDAIEFCSRLHQRTGRHYTLPSEAQWEYACRAGTTTPYHFGATITPELANYDAGIRSSDGSTIDYRQQTTPVGIFPANAWGLHDMHGNVWEWCREEWHARYGFEPQNAPNQEGPWSDGDGEEEAFAVKSMDLKDALYGEYTYRNWRIQITPTRYGYIYNTAPPGEEFARILDGLPFKTDAECMGAAKKSIDSALRQGVL